MAFEFKFRQARDPVDLYVKRNTYMIEKSRQRMENSEYNEILSQLAKDPENMDVKEKYVDFTINEAIL